MGVFDVSWPAPLLDYQRQGIAALMGRGTLLLADDMGLGKTVQAIAALRLMFSRLEVRAALIVVPAGLLYQWRIEIARWAPELTAIRVDGTPSDRQWKWSAEKQIFLVSYEVLRGDVARAKQRVWEVVVLDEAQRIKNRDAIISRITKRLPRRRAWALTGTPLENSEDELASVLEFVRPNPSGEGLPSLHPGPRLRAMQEDLQLRRRKQDVLHDLPPKTVVRVPLNLSPEQAETYAEVEAQGREGLLKLGSSAIVLNVLELILRLKEVCNFCPHTGRSSKLEDVKGRLSCLRAEGHRALLFSQWTNTRCGVARLAKELAAYNPLVYTGALDAAQRNAHIETFRRNAHHAVLLLSLRAGGQGLNLQEASYVFHFDRWWNPAVENQATDRVHRMGQKNSVTVYCYTTLHTIEERIELILDQKMALFSHIVDQVSIDVRTLITPDDLFGLFGLPAPQKPSRSHETKLSTKDKLIEKLRTLLTRAGWSVGSSETADIVATRHDELGFTKRLRCWGIVDHAHLDVVERPISKDESVELRVIAMPFELPESLKNNLERQGLACWDRSVLATLDATLPRLGEHK